MPFFVLPRIRWKRDMAELFMDGVLGTSAPAPARETIKFHPKRKRGGNASQIGLIYPVSSFCVPSRENAL